MEVFTGEDALETFDDKWLQSIDSNDDVDFDCHNDIFTPPPKEGKPPFL
jgi:hypothetical protein